MYGIGAFARLTGVTSKALYVYERRGLIKPRRTRAGYRRYTMHELQQLSRVLALKTLGLSLQEITRLQGSVAPKRPAAEAEPAATKRASAKAGDSRLADILARRRGVLEEKREQIDRTLRAIDAIERDDQPAVALHRFFGEANWDRWEAKRLEASSGVTRAPDRASPSRFALFREIAAALDRDPSGASAAPLAAEWNALLEREADGDAETIAAKRKAWTRRHRWPDGMRRYVASLYDTEPAVWERVAAFIDEHSVQR
jgi:DNA-binding transcriptional MerR regulator